MRGFRVTRRMTPDKDHTGVEVDGRQAGDLPFVAMDFGLRSVDREKGA